MSQTLLFDLDDTLIYCNKYFHLVLDQFADLMTTWFKSQKLTRAEILHRHNEIDIAGVAALGFKADHFPHSFVETYRHFRHLTGGHVSRMEEDELWRLGNSVYDMEVEPYPHMEETLRKLEAHGHELHLYTGGEPEIQQRKIDRMNLRRYFGERIYVRRHKNTEALEEILRGGSFNRATTWMIGNSLRTDVIPALQCGLHAVYLKQEAEWAFNVVPLEATPTGALLTLTSLPEVPPAIETYLTGNED